MKRLVIILFAIGSIVGLMISTCPNEEKHMDKVINEIGRIAFSKIDERETSIHGYVESAIVESNQESARLLIGNRLKVDDYVLFNIGRISFEDRGIDVTVGVFNHVFILKSANSLLEAVQEETTPVNVIKKMLDFIDDDRTN